MLFESQLLLKLLQVENVLIGLCEWSDGGCTTTEAGTVNLSHVGLNWLVGSLQGCS